MNPLAKDSTGNYCNAKIWFSLCAAIVLIKYSLSGAAFGSMSFGDFDATGASTLLAVFGGVYWGRSQTKVKEKQP